MEAFLRRWRAEAETRLQYDTAIFVGDKVLALTDSDDDLKYLARLHLANGNLTRAQSLLKRDGLVDRSPECRYLLAHSFVKEQRFEDALGILGDHVPAHLLATPVKNARRKLGKGDFRPSPETPAETRDEIRFWAGILYLRGICFAKQNAFEKAKDCYKNAVRIDVQCFEAFDQLMKNSLMPPAEEWEFLESLNWNSIDDSDSTSNQSSSQQASELVKMLYTTRLSKYKHPEELNNAVETLSTHYKLSTNADILLSKASLLFTQCKIREAHAITNSILQNDRDNFSALPIHLACLYDLNEKNALFLLSHDLSDKHPDEPVSWLAVGTYYLSINKIGEARRWFSKASMMDPHFGPAWIGFAHTFAAEGEHDQAISAYSTAARLFQGTHLPWMFLGMQNLQQQNYNIAHEYFNSAFSLCNTDPLLLNELGVLYYHENELENAIAYFQRSLELAYETGSDDSATLPTRINLAHALRQSRRWHEARAEYDDCLRHGGRDAGLFAAKALCLMEISGQAHMRSQLLENNLVNADELPPLEDPSDGDYQKILWDAIAALHSCLASNPQDVMGSELLARALEQSSQYAMTNGDSNVNGLVDADTSSFGGASDSASDVFEDVMAQKKAEAALANTQRARIKAMKRVVKTQSVAGEGPMDID